MNRPARSSLRTGAAGLLALALLLVAVLAVTGGSARRAGEKVAMNCPPRTRPADGPVGKDASDSAGQGAASRRACVPMGQPETFGDLNTYSTQLGARESAPFASTAPGAYLHAYAQSAGLRTARAAGEGNSWSVAGTPPECGAPSADGKVCPPASPENGQYSYTGALGLRTLSGRISSLAYDPSTQGHYFASPVVGGVWESRDAGGSWRPIGDPLPTQVVGAIAYDQPLHRVIAGTGDNSFGGSGIAGHGVFYTSDDGATWHAATGIPDLALSFKVLVSPADPSGQTVYAATSQGLFRSTNGGASFVNERLPTSPAGYSPNCQGVTNQSPGGTTSHLCFFANDVTDVIVKPAKTANAPAGAVIAAVGWRAGQKADTDASGNPVTTCTQNGAATTCLQAPQNGLYISSTGSPDSFKYMAPSGTSPQGLPDTSIIGRTALAVAHGKGQSSDAIYALIEDAQKFNGCPDVLDQVPPVCNKTATGEAIATVLNGLYASYDFGASWTKVMDSTQLKQPGTNSALLGQAGYSPGVQAWYNLWVEADPTATDSSSGLPTRVVFGLEEIWENNQVLPTTGPGGVLSTPYTAYPGGTAANDPWVVIGRYWNACGGNNSPVSCNANPTVASPIPGSTTHPDQHAYAMIPDGKGGETLLVGSDGGAFSQHIDAGGDFSNDAWGDGLNRTISAVQPYDAEMAKDGTIVAGLQDNGELKIAPSGHESEIFGGDGFFTTIDPAHSNNIIEEYTYANQVNLSLDGGTSWYPIQPSDNNTGSCGGPSGALFSTPIEQDPTMAGHVLLGCGEIQEATNIYQDPCATPDGGNPTACPAANVPFTTVFDLNTLPAPNGASNTPSALAVRGANEYVAYCGYCDPATQKVPFANGIATNVGGSKPPQIGTGDGWHQAAAKCANCGTANGLLPERYINSIQEDPKDPNTVYVTLGGYGRRWIPPGSFGEDVSNVGVGHVFVSHDHGEHFTDVTGNLPDISANWTEFHDGKLIVATDLGVFIQTSAGGSGQAPTYATLGTGLPAVPVFTIRVSPADPNMLLISTFGRGVWKYSFATAAGGKGGGSGSGGGTKQGGRGKNYCPKPSGGISGTHLGPLSLGLTKAQASGRISRGNPIGANYRNYCLKASPGIRAGYPSSRLLRTLSRAERRRVQGRIILLLTANRYYALRGVRVGTPTRAALRRLRGRAVHVHAGVNDWYLVRYRGVGEVLKIRGGRVEEVGIADGGLTRSPRADRVFFTSF